MYRLTYEIGKIGKYMTLKLSFIAKDDQVTQLQLKQAQIFNHFNYLGNEYFNLSLKPYITIEITNPMTITESGRSFYDPNMRVNVNRYGIFWLIKALHKMKENFINIKDLYYYYDGKLMINKDKVNDASFTFRVNNKQIMLIPSLIQDDEASIIHEGILFCINEKENFCPLNYAEMEYLLYVIQTIDIESVMTLLLTAEQHPLASNKRTLFNFNKDQQPQQNNLVEQENVNNEKSN